MPLNGSFVQLDGTGLELAYECLSKEKRSAVGLMLFGSFPHEGQECGSGGERDRMSPLFNKTFWGVGWG